MTNEEMTLEALKLCRKTRNFIPANEYLDTAINLLEENDKLKAEIEWLKNGCNQLEIRLTKKTEIETQLRDIVERLKSKLSSVETKLDLKEYDAKRNANIMSFQLKIIEQLKEKLEKLNK